MVSIRSRLDSIKERWSQFDATKWCRLFDTIGFQFILVRQFCISKTWSELDSNQRATWPVQPFNTVYSTAVRRCLARLNVAASNLSVIHSPNDACRQFPIVSHQANQNVLLWSVYSLPISGSLCYRTVSRNGSWNQFKRSASETVFFVWQINSNQSISRLFRTLVL